jgi:hypothetical protein
MTEHMCHIMDLFRNCPVIKKDENYKKSDVFLIFRLLLVFYEGKAYKF